MCVGWRRGLTLALSALAPRHCAGCDQVDTDRICAACAGALSRLPQPAPRATELGAIRAAFEFEEPARRIIHRAKYAGERAALEALSELAASRVCGPGSPPPELVVPVPLGRRRRRARGFNQAEVIATVLATSLGTPVAVDLARVRETAPQVGTDERARAQNVTGAFAWHGPSLAGSCLWLVDDVLTTGATTAAAASTLAAAGAGRVEVAVLALVP